MALVSNGKEERELTDGPIDRLVRLGFSEYEAKAYVAMLRESPVTGYHISKVSGVPRSMIYEVLGKLVARGAAMTVHVQSGTRYAPVPPVEFLDHLHREHGDIVATLKEELVTNGLKSEMEYVWNIDGHDNVIAKVLEMIDQAGTRIYMSLLPATFPALQSALARAVRRGVRVMIYSTRDLDLPGGGVIVSPVPEEASETLKGLWLVMVVDGEEALIGEWLTADDVRASWTGDPLFVFVAEHHLRTDLYLPQVLALLGDQAMDIIREEDQELFAYAMQIRIGHRQS